MGTFYRSNDPGPRLADVAGLRAQLGMLEGTLWRDPVMASIRTQAGFTFAADEFRSQVFEIESDDTTLTRAAAGVVRASRSISGAQHPTGLSMGGSGAITHDGYEWVEVVSSTALASYTIENGTEMQRLVIENGGINDFAITTSSIGTVTPGMRVQLQYVSGAWKQF